MANKKHRICKSDASVDIVKQKSLVTVYHENAAKVKENGRFTVLFQWLYKDIKVRTGERYGILARHL